MTTSAAMIRRSAISPMVIFVCGCIPHDSADRARREAARASMVHAGMISGRQKQGAQPYAPGASVRKAFELNMQSAKVARHRIRRVGLGREAARPKSQVQSVR